jgi:hypothetical protein
VACTFNGQCCGGTCCPCGKCGGDFCAC